MRLNSWIGHHKYRFLTTNEALGEMEIPVARTSTYGNFFRSQRGGGDIPVFLILGGYQSGQGFWAYFRGLLRRVIPIACNVGKPALTAMSDTLESGASMEDRLKAAVRPALSALLESPS